MNERSQPLPVLSEWDWKSRIGGWGLRYNEKVSPWIILSMVLLGALLRISAISWSTLLALLPLCIAAVLPYIATVIGLRLQRRIRWVANYEGWRLSIYRYRHHEAEVHALRFHGGGVQLQRALEHLLRPEALEIYARHNVRITFYSHFLDRDAGRRRLVKAFQRVGWQCIRGTARMGPFIRTLLWLPAAARERVADIVDHLAQCWYRCRFEGKSLARWEQDSDPVALNYLLLLPILLRRNRTELFKLTFVPPSAPADGEATHT